MKRAARVLLMLPLVLSAAPVAPAAGWELRRDDLDARRPPVQDGVVTINAGDPAAAFPRYLNDIGVQAIRIRFRDDGPRRKRLSVVWSGGSQGVDRFAVRVDGIAAGVSRAVDSARRPYAWYRDDFTVTLGAQSPHVVEILPVPESSSAIDFAGIRLSDAGEGEYRPLCYESIGTLERYEAASGGRGVAIPSEHLTVFAPKEYEADAKRLSAFLERACGVMRDLYGTEPTFRFSVEHYPPGHARAWGGISGAGTIGYTTEALERFGKLGTTDVRGFAGYTEEMSHGFKAVYKCPGTFEALGVAVQEDVVRRLVPAEVADRFWAPEHAQWDETHRAYLAAGRRNPDPEKYPEGVLYTRILNDVFQKLRNEYGPRMWPDFFATVRQMDYPLHRVKETETMATYAGIFSALFGRDMRPEFTRHGIALDTDPPWGPRK